MNEEVDYSDDIPIEQKVIFADEIIPILQAFQRVVFERRDEVNLEGFVYDLGHTNAKFYDEVLPSIIKPFTMSYNPQDDVETEQAALQNIVKEISSKLKADNEYQNDMRSLFHKINNALINGHFDPITMERICQLPNCDNILPDDMPANAKYCVECRVSGRLKKMYNDRSNGKLAI